MERINWTPRARRIAATFWDAVGLLCAAVSVVALGFLGAVIAEALR